MMAIALVPEGGARKSAAETCRMDRHMPRDWVHRYNAEGVGGPDEPYRHPGRRPRLTLEQKAGLAAWVEAGPDPERDARRSEPAGDDVLNVYHQVAFFDERSPMARSIRAAIYARYSSDLSRDASIEDQVRLCRQHADRLGCTVTEVFEDRAISGASAIRPGYQALLAAVGDGEIDIVLAEALDRLSRDQEDVAALQAMSVRTAAAAPSPGLFVTLSPNRPVVWPHPGELRAHAPAPAPVAPKTGKRKKGRSDNGEEGGCHWCKRLDR
jgi:hypothetical protein